MFENLPESSSPMCLTNMVNIIVSRILLAECLNAIGSVQQVGYLKREPIILGSNDKESDLSLQTSRHRGHFVHSSRK